jgi:ankyrin repeat protein
MGSEMQIVRRHAGWLWVTLLAFVTLSPGGLGHAAGDSALVDAAKQGNFTAVRAQIARRADVNAPARDGSTALLWAAYHSDVAAVKSLVAAGAKVNVANKYGVTPLLQASRAGDTPVMQALIDAGADVSMAHPDGETPLMAASRTGRTDAVRLLLARGAKPNAIDSYQQQAPLMWAASEGHAEVIGMLIEAGANPNVRAHVTALDKREHADHPTGGFTPLMFAARAGHEAAIRALAKGGADLNITNGDGATAMMIAIVNDRFDLARTLLDLGADPNDGSLYFAVDMHDATTDMRARDGSRLRADHPNKLNALDLVKLLLDKGADPNKQVVGQLHSTSLCCGDFANGSAFYRAAIASDVEALKLMIERGAQIEWVPVEYKAATGENGRGANANVGKTPIMVAMAGGRGAGLAGGPGFTRLGLPPFREQSNRDPVEALKVLLAAGADVNAKAPDGSTALHQAVQARKLELIKTLAGAGAKFDIKNRDNLTALELAEKPEGAARGGDTQDPNLIREKRATRQEVIVLMRELMGLPPADAETLAGTKKVEEKKDDKKPEAPAAAAAN